MLGSSEEHSGTVVLETHVTEMPSFAMLNLFKQEGSINKEDSVPTFKTDPSDLARLKLLCSILPSFTFLTLDGLVPRPPSQTP